MSRRTGPTAATVRAVRERDGWRCVRCGDRYQLTTQHRVARGMGGTKARWINEPANLITLCGSGTTGCHGLVEANPEWARLNGWSVRRGRAPETVPVRTWAETWILLDNEAGLAPSPVGGV